MTNPGDALGAFTEVRLVHHAAVADLFSAVSADGRPVVLVALTAEASADQAWRAAFADLIARDRAAVNPADPQYSVAHAGDLNGARPWVGSYYLPGRRGVERILTVIPGGAPPGVDPTAMVGSAFSPASAGFAGPSAAAPPVAPWAQPAPWAAEPAPPPAQSAPPPTQPTPWTEQPSSRADQAAAPTSAAPAPTPAQPATPQWSTPPEQPATPQWSMPSEQPATPQWSTPPEQPATPQWSAPPSAQTSTPPWSTPVAQTSTPPWSTPVAQTSTPPWSSSAQPQAPVSAAPQPSYPQAEYGAPPPEYPGGSSPGPAYAAPAAPVAPGRSRVGIVIGLITVITALVMVGAGFAVVLLKNNDKTPAAAAPTSAAASPLPANTAGPSPTPSRSPLPSTTPTLRTAAKQVSVVGPTWQPSDATQNLALTGWPFAFRLPEGWSCLRGTSKTLPDADIWGCVKTEGTSHQQRMTVMLRRCPTTCTADEQSTMNDAWFDSKEKPNVKKFDATTYWVETAKNDDGFYAVDFSHFYADAPGGTLTYEVGVWFQSPDKYKTEMQKSLNDIRSQAPQPA